MDLATLRRETAKVVDLAERDLRRVWRLVESGESPEEALHDILPSIVTEYGTLAAAAAAVWYDRQRERAAARRMFTAMPIAATDRGTHALVGFALNKATDDTSLQTLILGGTQRRIADHQRLTITSSSVADPAAGGWVRVGVGECTWCRQYLDGEVRTVPYDFDAHDHCKCGAVPAF